MSDGTNTGDEARRRRARHPVVLAVAICCYVLGAIVGFFMYVRRRSRDAEGDGDDEAKEEFA